MKYKFFTGYSPGRQKDAPYVVIEENDKYGDLFNTEINNLQFEYLCEIVDKLVQVIQGELEQYDFGYEVYVIECKKDISTVVDTFDGWVPKAEIPTKEVYELIKDWKEYIENSVKDK